MGGTIAQRVTDILCECPCHSLDKMSDMEARLREEDEPKYPSASLTADIVCLRGDGGPASVEVLLITRGGEPFKGVKALPGGFVDARNDERGETPLVAAHRELMEETGIDIPLPSISYGRWRWHKVGVYANPGRDPRGRVISFAYLAVADIDVEPVAGDDAAKAEWVELSRALNLPLAFDHAQILEDAARLWIRDQWLASH